MQRNHQPNNQGHGQAAFADFADAFLGNRARDGIGRKRSAKGINGQGAAEGAFGVNLAYHETHVVAPVVSLSTVVRESMPQKPPVRLFERYWFLTHVPVAIQFLADAWNNILWPALQKAWAFISTKGLLKNNFPICLPPPILGSAVGVQCVQIVALCDRGRAYGLPRCLS